MTGLDLTTQLIARSTVLLAAAFAATWLLRNRAAALRHFVWTAILSALLLLPVLTAVTPKWGWRQTAPGQPVISVRTHSVPISVAPVPAPVRVRPPWLLLAWTVGFLIVAVRFAIGAARTARMVQRASRSSHSARFPVLESAEAPVALAWGIRSPAIVLPVEAGAWPADRLRAVLLHEQMHVERRDLLAQAIGQAACCLYWFHPLAWLAARELRKERERACDDAVLLSGIPAHDYAAHLVALVRAMAAHKTEWAGAAGMAERSDLESRVRALLDRRRSRSPLSRRAAVAVGAAIVAMLLPLAVVSSYAQATGSGFAGVVRDPSGAVVPNCSITAKNLDGSNEESTTSDAAGQYRFANIPSGRYQVEYRSAGFRIAQVELTVAAGTVARADTNLQIGQVNEVVTITAQKPATAALPLTAGTPQRIRVGGMVQMTRLIVQPRPVYPADAQQAGVEGTVKIRAIISKDGLVMSPRVVNTVDARLAQAALDAVQQWRYQPTLLNGEPVEVLTNIDLEFKLNP